MYFVVPLHVSSMKPVIDKINMNFHIQVKELAFKWITFYFVFVTYVIKNK